MQMPLPKPHADLYLGTSEDACYSTAIQALHVHTSKTQSCLGGYIFFLLHARRLSPPGWLLHLAGEYRETGRLSGMLARAWKWRSKNSPKMKVPQRGVLASFISRRSSNSRILALSARRRGGAHEGVRRMCRKSVGRPGYG